MRYPLVADELASAARENRRQAGQARAVLLADAGREPPDAATVWKHGAADRRAALADRIKRGGGQAIRSKEPGTWRERYEKSLEMRQFCVLPYLEKAELAPFRGCRSRSG